MQNGCDANYSTLSYLLSLLRNKSFLFSFITTVWDFFVSQLITMICLDGLLKVWQDFFFSVTRDEWSHYVDITAK